ncbi:UDP-3-O-[3-hydroxymyristoyl] N-acetylglucosamine deacetylase [candidate division WOR-3 bacterium]|nr:UDP-3-O-[3-hydroxymyristoyl] N-acetylglucosamine deacetylase [candidate division WOR-3 bacterium]
MKERTIKKNVEFSGIGVHTGKKSRIILCPTENDGIRFVKNGEVIPAALDNVKYCDREITLSKNGKDIRTVEHLMGALYACKIDHLRVVVEGDEIPALDGSAYPFISEIEETGIKELKSKKRERYIKRNITVEDKGCFASCAPAKKLEIHYIISYDHPLLHYQEYIFNGKCDFKEIAKCRTYGLLSWKEELNKRGFALGASEDNTLIYTDNGMLNEARFPDEAVRHKIVDFIGELYLFNPIPIGRYFVFRGGHLLHFQLIKEIKRSENGIQY